MQKMRGTVWRLGQKRPFCRWASPFNPLELAETAQTAPGETSALKARIEGGCSRRSGARKKSGHLSNMPQKELIELYMVTYIVQHNIVDSQGDWL